MFITNNHDSFHLWWHENFVKHQNVSKYYDQDYSLSILFPYVPAHLYINNNKDMRKDKNISFVRKLISPFNVQANKRKYEKPFKSVYVQILV